VTRTNRRDNAGARPYLSRAGGVILALTAVAGLALGVHGWSTRGGATIPGLAAGPTAGPTTAPPVSATSPAQPGTSQQPAKTQHTPQPGPLLKSQSFAQFSYQVWPGVQSAAARSAMTGLVISVHQRAGGIFVVAGVRGQASTPGQFYPAGTRVYVIEAALGDDSGGSDYNLGDDGLIVTNAAGRILQ
jgi:hypothetical protein